MRIKNYEIKKKYAQLTLKWCKKKFGKSPTKKRKLIFDFTNKEGYYGKQPIYGKFCFSRNKITIYSLMCDTLNEIVSTVIHEYTHYLQSGYQYRIYQKKYYYSQNPYEKQAKKYEKLYTIECIRYIRTQSKTSKSGTSFK